MSRDAIDKAVGASLRKLARDAKALEKALRKVASDLAVEQSIYLVGMLAEATPVDTSKALSNWVVSVGFPRTREIEAHFLGEAGSTREASIQVVKDNAEQALEKKNAGQIIWIANNTSYMEDLARGHSRQADDGWIQAILGIAERKFQPRWPIIM